jgi:hypothetical protein
MLQDPNQSNVDNQTMSDVKLLGISGAKRRKL